MDCSGRSQRASKCNREAIVLASSTLSTTTHRSEHCEPPRPQNLFDWHFDGPVCSSERKRRSACYMQSFGVASHTLSRTEFRVSFLWSIRVHWDLFSLGCHGQVWRHPRFACAAWKQRRHFLAYSLPIPAKLHCHYSCECLLLLLYLIYWGVQIGFFATADARSTHIHHHLGGGWPRIDSRAVELSWSCGWPRYRPTHLVLA